MSRREGEGVEKEADTFAAYLLMPLHDFRARIHPDAKPTIDDLSDCATRYGVSLTAAVLRWLEYTNRRSLFIVSNDDYAIWAKASGPAFRSGRFIRTRNTMYELPPASLVRTRPEDLDMKVGVKQPAGVSFDEPAEEMCVTSTRHVLDMTLLHLGTDWPGPGIRMPTPRMSSIVCREVRAMTYHPLLFVIAEFNRQVQPLIVWRSGPTGAGKSSLAEVLGSRGWGVVSEFIDPDIFAGFSADPIGIVRPCRHP